MSSSTVAVPTPGASASTVGRGFTVDRILAAVSVVWLALIPLAPGALAIWVTLTLLVIDSVVCFGVLIRCKRVPVLLNLAQLGLFTVVHYQVYSVWGTHHYTWGRPPGLLDWLELTGAHVLRAVDLLDFIEEYGIQLQNVKHNSSVSGCLLVMMHVTVDIFLLGVAIRGGKKLLKWLLQRWAKREEMGQATSVDAQKKSLVSRIREDLEAAKLPYFLLCVGIYAICAKGQEWPLSDWLLWPVDTIVRVIDFPDIMQIFDLRFHQVPKDIGLSTLAVTWRLLAGLYIAVWITRFLLFVRAPVPIEELIEKLGNRSPTVKESAALRLGESGPEAHEAVPALIRILVDENVTVRERAREALRMISSDWARHPEAGDALPALHEALSHADRGVQWYAVQTLGELGRPASIPPLVVAWVFADVGVHVEVRMALRNIDPDWARHPKAAEALPRLMQALKHADATVRRSAVVMLGDLRIPATIPRLIAARCDEEVNVRTAASESLVSTDRDWARHPQAAEALPDLERALRHPDSTVRQAAAETMEELRLPVGVSPLIRALHDQEAPVRAAAIEGLGKTGSAAVPELVKALTDDSADFRVAAVKALGRAGPVAAQALPDLARALQDHDSAMRRSAAEALGELGLPAGTLHLVAALGDAEAAVRAAAARALGRIGPRAISAVAPLCVALADEDEYTRTIAAKALDMIDPNWAQSDQMPSVIPGLLRVLKKKTGNARPRAEWVLSIIGSAAVIPLTRALGSPDEATRKVAVEALGAIGVSASSGPSGLSSVMASSGGVVVCDTTTTFPQLGSSQQLATATALQKHALPALIPMLVHESQSVRDAVRKALGLIDTNWPLSAQASAAIGTLIQAVVCPKREIRDCALATLNKIDPNWRQSEPGLAAIPALLKNLAARNGDVRDSAAEALSAIDPNWPRSKPASVALTAFIKSLDSSDSHVRGCAAKALVRIGAAAIPALIEALTGRDDGPRIIVADVLKTIGPEARPAVPALIGVLRDRNMFLGHAAKEALDRIDPNWQARAQAKA